MLTDLQPWRPGRNRIELTLVLRRSIWLHIKRVMLRWTARQEDINDVPGKWQSGGSRCCLLTPLGNVDHRKTHQAEGTGPDQLSPREKMWRLFFQGTVFTKSALLEAILSYYRSSSAAMLLVVFNDTS